MLPRSHAVLRVVLVVAYRVAVVIAVVVQSDAVELFEWICNLAHGSGKTRVQWHTLDFRHTNIYTLALLDVPEVGGFYALTLVGDDGWFRMAQ